MASDKESVGHIIDKHRPELESFEKIYKDFHQNPELSCQESRTSSLAAGHLEELGFVVHRNVGGHGVVGVLENGPGRKVLLRADMDGLPIEEKTGLPYASRARMVDTDGKETFVMHACGHDTHVTSLMAASTLLVSAKEAWKGTLICLFQPNEERAGGAQAMVDDGLYQKVPKPDIVLGQHVYPIRAGSVSILNGAMLTAASSLNVRIFGKGGHGSEPQSCIDPIMIAAYVLVRLQSIVSREMDPQEPTVVTCGSIQAGSAANVIPDHVDLKLNVRNYNEALHEKVLEKIKKIVQSECEVSQSPKPPEIEITNQFPPTVNDDKLVEAIRATFEGVFKEKLVDEPRWTASEDFSVLATAVGAPYAYWSFGGIDAKRYDDAFKLGKQSQLSRNHSSGFAPAIEPTIRTGIDAMAAAALTFLCQ